MSVDKVDLASDFSTVSKKEAQSADIEKSIINFTATPIQVLEWAYSRDPLIESQVVDMSKDKVKSKIASNRMHLIYKCAALTIMAHHFNPELQDMNSEKRGGAIRTLLRVNDFTEEEKIEHRRKREDLIKEGKITKSSTSVSENEFYLLSATDKLLEFYISQISTLDPLDVNISSTENLKTYLQVADLISKSSYFGDRYPETSYSTYQSRENSVFLSERIYKIVSDEGLKSESYENQYLGAKAKWALNASKGYGMAWPIDDTVRSFLGSESIEGKIVDTRYIYDMIATIRKIYVENDSIKLNDSRVKGNLHELLWFLDFNVAMLNDKHNVDVFCNPSTQFDDFPLIGKPKYNRAYDYEISNVATGKFVFVQLKSGVPHYEKKYHPSILELRETNNPYTQRSRLRSKLTALEKYVGHQTDENWDVAKDYILGTVFEAKDYVAHSEPHHFEMMADSYKKHQEVPRNNGARRRLMKDLRKRGVKLG
jgi:hypothetical protein